MREEATAGFPIGKDVEMVPHDREKREAERAEGKDMERPPERKDVKGSRVRKG